MKNPFQPASAWAFVLIAGLLSSCSLQKEVELDLPDPQRRMVVESYLQPGQPFILALQQEAGYFEPISQKPAAPPAEVTISYDSTTITLQEVDAATLAQITAFLGPDAPAFLQQYASLGYIRIYFSNLLDPTQLVPEKYDTDFRLRVQDTTGRLVTATARIPRPVPIDSLKSSANAKGKSYVLTYAADNGQETNYYRRILRRSVVQYDTLRDQSGTITSIDSSRVQRIDQDFIVDDDIYNGGIIFFGTAYDYVKGDTVQSELYNISKDYYNFIESSQFAQQANGNPFGQPAVIKSNVVGGLGIFAGYVPSIKTMVIE